VDGLLRAKGIIDGATGESGVSQPLPNLDPLRIPGPDDVDVATEFNDYATWVNSAIGGQAWQIPEEHPSHIFRMNVSDRSSEVNSTAKNDYFLEDPYEAMASTAPITFSGTSGDPGVDSSNKVFFIDGNLWVHHATAMSFLIDHLQSESVTVSFVVKGNIYFSDDVLTKNPETDGLAFIALIDPDVADSGNIYFGDPAFGTLDTMTGYMYAENNFYDNNLGTSGSTRVTIKGLMSAGNHVAINRDNGEFHTKLVLDFDDRLMDGSLVLPGIPVSSNDLAANTVILLSSYEVAPGDVYTGPSVVEEVTE
jgi:hypothetical protein